jgi:hypothetical protein
MLHFPAIVVALTLVCAMLLSACSQQQQADDKSVISQQTAIGSGTGTGIGTGIGTAIDLGTGAMYPGGFPIAQYPGSRVTTSTSSGSEGMGPSTKAIVLTSGDDIYKIGQFYQSELTKGGWQINHMSVMGNLLNMEAVKGKSKATITVTNNGDSFNINGQNTGKSNISLVVLSKQ